VFARKKKTRTGVRQATLRETGNPSRELKERRRTTDRRNCTVHGKSSQDHGGKKEGKDTEKPGLEQATAANPKCLIQSKAEPKPRRGALRPKPSGEQRTYAEEKEWTKEMSGTVPNGVKLSISKSKTKITRKNLGGQLKTTPGARRRTSHPT